MHHLIEENIDKIREYCDELGIKEMYAFGSSVKSGTEEESELSFFITFKDLAFNNYVDSYFELRELLEELLQKPVDLVTEKSLSNPNFKKAINETKQLIYPA